MNYGECQRIVEEHNKRENSKYWASLFGVTVHQVHSFFNHNKPLKAKYLESRPNRSEPIRDFLEQDGKQRTYKEWAKEIGGGYKAYDVSNAVAKYPHLEGYIVLERIRNYHKFPVEWDQFIIENSGKYTCSELDQIFGLKEGTVNSHCNKRNINDMWKHTKKHTDKRTEQIIDKFESIKDDLPLSKATIIEKVGYLGPKDYKLIQEKFGLRKRDIYIRPKIEAILKAIHDHPHQESMAHWADLFGVDISHVSRLVHSHKLLHKLKPSRSIRDYDDYKSVNTNKRHNIEEIELS